MVESSLQEGSSGVDLVIIGRSQSQLQCDSRNDLKLLVTSRRVELGENPREEGTTRIGRQTVRKRRVRIPGSGVSVVQKLALVSERCLSKGSGSAFAVSKRLSSEVAILIYLLL